MGKDLKGKELGKNLCQRKDGLYEAKYTDNFGKRHSIYDKKLSEVRRKLNEALYNKEHNIYNQTCKLTLNEWFDQWVVTFYKGTVKPTTYTSVLNSYNRSVRNSKLGNMLLTSINPIHIQQFANEIVQERNLKRDSAKVYLIPLKQVIKKAYECGYMQTNPAEHIILPKTKKDEKHALTRNELILFFRFAKKSSYYELFKVLLLTGMRLGEALALTWDDIDFEEQLLSINKNRIHVNKSQRAIFQELGCELVDGEATYISTPKTESSKRIIPLNDACVNVFKELYEDRNVKFNMIFHTKKGKYFNNSSIDSAIWKICEQINEIHTDGIRRFSAHAFRHTFTTICYENGIDVKTIQFLLGHSNLNTTLSIYTHLNKEKIMKDVYKINFDSVMS